MAGLSRIPILITCTLEHQSPYLLLSCPMFQQFLFSLLFLFFKGIIILILFLFKIHTGLLERAFSVLRLKPNTVGLVQQFDVLIEFWLTDFCYYTIIFRLILTCKECVSLFIYLPTLFSFNYLTSNLNPSGLFSLHYTKTKITSGVSPVQGLLFSY